MGKRKRGGPSAAEAEAEAWLAAAREEFENGGKKQMHSRAAPKPPPQVSEFLDPDAPDAVQAAASSLACLRLALALNVGSAKWRSHEEATLAEHLRSLRSQDEEFQSELRVYHTAAGNGSPIASSTDALMPALKLRGAMDALYWSLWGLACRREIRIPHPVRLAERVAKELLQHPATARAVVLSAALTTSNRQAARRMGFRPSWLEAALRAAAQTSSPWCRGACAMLRYLRSRWVEGCVLVAADESAAAARNAATVDGPDAKVRAALLRWQYVGRDACARHMAFACPSSAALDEAMRAAQSTHGQRGGSGGNSCGIVELGAGNGYWSKLLAKRARSFACSVRALDVDPPPEWKQPAEARVSFGTADEVSSGRERTLLLCMPSPGEAGIAEAALDAFEAPRPASAETVEPQPPPLVVLYVGEWASGMTGTKALHARLLADYTLIATRPLPCLPLARIALHVFRRLPTRRRNNHDARADDGMPSEPTSPHRMPPKLPRNALCLCCGAARGLKVCPWTRILMCSETCHAKAADEHAAAIAMTYCGAKPTTRPSFASFAPSEHLEATSATAQQWLRLAEATPQPERIIPV